MTNINWQRHSSGRKNYIFSPDGQIYITRFEVQGNRVYVLSNKQQHIAAFHGDQALERAKTKALLEFDKNLDEANNANGDAL